MTKSVIAIILAAGDGKRMQSITPKVMSLLHGRPLVDYVVSAVEESRLTEKPVVIVSPKHTLVQEFLKERATYIIQKEQLGTGHAVGSASDLLKNKFENIIVLYGDMPFISSSSIKKLISEHEDQKNTITMATVVVPNFLHEYRALYSFGRVVRDSSGKIIRSVEMKDASEEEKNIKEVNPCYYCFQSDWLWPHLASLKNINAQSEYYLTDLIKMAIDEGQKISSVSIDPYEAIGINTKEDLETAHTLKA
jgi:bifunctional UDP-N-acetylglucosamine pyrophosphorylase/glucosamine-1-phosphate N-acetyltransferase